MQKSTQWPDGFELNQKLYLYAANREVPNIEDEWEHFQQFHRARGSKFVEWERAWYTWVLNVVKWRKNGNGKRPESFGERNIRETTELCRRVGERAEKVLREMAEGVPKSTNGAGTPSLFRGLIGPKP